MPYTATRAAHQSQFGATVVEFNLTGDEGRPSRRTAIKLKTETPTARDFNDALTVAVTRAEVDHQDVMAANIARRLEEETAAKVKARLDQYVATLAATAEAQLKAQITSLRLPPDEQAVANRIVLKVEGI